MNTSLSEVGGLPAAELLAMRLDGEVFALGNGWFPVDVPDSPRLRIAAVMAGRSDRLIAGEMTAAWVWGATSPLPSPLTLLSDVRARARLRPGSDAVVREVTFTDGDVVTVGAARVTSPRRTLVDLARAEVSVEVLRALASVAGVDREEALAAFERRRRPGDLGARRRISAALP